MLVQVRRWGSNLSCSEKTLTLHMQSTTSAILWGLGDVLAQKIEGYGKHRKFDKRRMALTAGFGACFMGPVG